VRYGCIGQKLVRRWMGLLAMRVVTLFLRHGNEKYADAEREMDAIFACYMPGVERRIVIIDNALPPHVIERREERFLIGGDNTFWEFSGWGRGIEFLGTQIWDYDLVHLATSAFNTLYVKYLHRFTPEMLAAVSRRPVCLGHIDCFNEAVRLLSFQSQHWIRSCFLFLAPAELKALGSLVSIRDGSRFFSGNPEQPFRPDAPVSENCRKYILGWLTGRDIGQGATWHSAFELTDATLPAFERKTLAIMNEHLLAIRLRSLNTMLIDTTWLATCLANGGIGTIPWGLNWREQVAGRDTDSLLISPMVTEAFKRRNEQP